MIAGTAGSRAWTRLRSPWWAAPAGAALAAATLVRYGVSANGFAFVAAQLVLVALAVVDVETRRLPNHITLPASLLALLVRGVLEPSGLGAAGVAGVGALLAFGILSIVLRGGIGMGDAKLAGMLGFILGSAVVPALVIGTLLGAFASLGLVLIRRARLSSAIAYGPYLALGGAIAILVYHPHALA